MTCPCGRPATVVLQTTIPSLVGLATRRERPYCPRCAERTAAMMLARGARRIEGRVAP